MSESTASSSRMGSTPVPLVTSLFPETLKPNLYDLPNIPKPINGMIKTYDTTHRSFSRPYSAKTVFFYKEGDNYFTGLRVPVSKARYRNMDSLLDDLNSSIPMPFGVRRLHTPYGKTPISNLDQLQHLGKYVVSSSKRVKPLDMDAVERHQARMQEIARHRWERMQQTQATSASTSAYPSARYNGGFKSSKTIGLFLPMTAKQMFFVLNGHPGRIYRVVLNPYRRVDMETVLEEVSQGLETCIVKVYTFSGERVSSIEQLLALRESRVLAVPRHEKPLLQAGTQQLQPQPQQAHSIKESSSTSLTSVNSTSVTLPAIRPAGNQTTTNYRVSQRPHHQTTFALIKPPVQRTNHSIERTRLQPASTLRRDPVPPRRTFNDYNSHPGYSGFRNSRTTRVAPPAIPYSKATANSNRRVMSLKARKPVPAAAAAAKSPSSNNSAHSAASAENDSDSGRPRSTDFEEDGKDDERSVTTTSRTSRTTGSSAIISHTDSDDYPDMDANLTDADSLDSPPPSRASNVTPQTPASLLESPRAEDGASGSSNSGRKRKAAVTIQAYTRGHLARKKLKDTAQVAPGAGGLVDVDGDYSEPEQSERFTDDEEADDASRVMTPAAADDGADYSEPEQSEHLTDAEAEGGVAELEENRPRTDYSEAEQSEHPDPRLTQVDAAIIIQKHWRGHRVRRGLAEKRGESRVDVIEEGVMDTDEEEERHLDSSFGRNEEEEEEDVLDDSMTTYLVRVYTGNRWAADTETDLYVVLHGDDGDSEKRILQQDFINWLQSEQPKFVQGQIDDFLITIPSVGRLRKVTIGHQHNGYGGGVFIDQLIVIEGGSSNRQYLFQCYKWLDSGQVDGKLERVVKCTALYHGQTSQKKSQGRWELILYNGTEDGLGATSSNLNIFGYSHDVMSRSMDIYDNTLAAVPSKSLVQVDFGVELADLTKIRVEIDGSGDKPDYYLDHVELIDLDTDDRIEVTVDKWLRWESEEKGAQAFRELVVFKGAADTLPLCTYEGKLRLPVNRMPLSNANVKIELFGENGESGVFPVSIANKDNKKDKYDVSFRIEAVNLGRFIGVRMYFDPTPAGEAVYEGLDQMQKMFDKHGVETSVGDDFIVQHALIRESTHTPYRMVLEHSRIVPRRDEQDSYVKELRTSRMEGLSTKLKKAKTVKRKTPTWVVSMLLDDRSTLLPRVTLCGEDGIQDMACLDTSPVDNIIGFQLKNAEVGALRKIRVAVDRTRGLNVLPEDGVSLGARVYVKKMRVCDAANGDEVRFPAAKIELFEYSAVEFPAIWPDVQPMDSNLYDVVVSTAASESTLPFSVHVNLVGELGDTGYRYLGEPDGKKPTLFDAQSQKAFQVESVTVGEVQRLFVRVEAAEAFEWSCQEIVVSEPESGLFYAFHFDKPFTPGLTVQECLVSPFTSAL